MLVDPAGGDAIFNGRLEVEELFCGEHDFAGETALIPIALIEPFENGARIQCLADEVLLLGIEKMRNELAVFTHSRRPEVHRLRIVDRRISGRELLQSRHGSFRLMGGVREEERKHERPHLAGAWASSMRRL